MNIKGYAGVMMSIKFSGECKNICEAINAANKILKPIHKSGNNTAQNYKYAKFEDFMEGIKDALCENGLSIITSVGNPNRLDPRSTKFGGQMYVVEVSLTMRLLHKSGEWIEIECYGEGQDSGDKAIYKAITGARKYAIACLLGLSTSDDPEKDDEPPASQKQFLSEKDKAEKNKMLDLIKESKSEKELDALIDSIKKLKPAIQGEIKPIFVEKKLLLKEGEKTDGE